MTDKKITKEEIERLINLKDRHTADTTNFLTTTFIATTGFCLATLSASSIPALINLIITISTLVIFLLALFRNKYKSSPLHDLQSLLRGKYSTCKNSLSFIDDHDPWKGFQREKITVWTGAFISTLFVIYTATNHLIKIAQC
ncbi:hypothetical protein [Pseudomonas sp.]|uniref:hypothetical protein n=1 Tax=Pseudomonas sp. TaxID=306 RepID=UPI002CA7C612|nr:hypothetical protein [Pseudomonas sp.]HUE92227.1 hypothetical protein [Pseudomonas sp.]